MAGIRTKSDLIDKIAAEHAWRKREITELKNIISTDSNSDLRKKVLCRSGFAILYAHWEGFVKVTGSYFLEFVANQRHSVEELKSSFITVLLKSKFEAASESNKIKAYDEITEFLLNKRGSRARMRYSGVIDTGSNLSSSTLKDITWSLGIDYSHFSPKENLIDLRLVGQRNHIAHGRNLNIDEDDFLEMTDEVTTLMNIFRNLLENSAMTGEYKN